MHLLLQLDKKGTLRISLRGIGLGDSRVAEACLKLHSYLSFSPFHFIADERLDISYFPMR